MDVCRDVHLMSFAYKPKLRSCFQNIQHSVLGKFGEHIRTATQMSFCLSLKWSFCQRRVTGVEQDLTDFSMIFRAGEEGSWPSAKEKVQHHLVLVWILTVSVMFPITYIRVQFDSS